MGVVVGAGLVGDVGLTTTGVAGAAGIDAAGTEEGGLTAEEDLFLQRGEFWRFLRGTRGRSTGAGMATRAAMALWW